MPRIVLPRGELAGMPAVCVVTGETEGIAPRELSFTHVPAVNIGTELLPFVLLGVGVHVSRRYRVSLPLSPRGAALYGRSRLILALVYPITLAVIFAFGGWFLFARGPDEGFVTILGHAVGSMSSFVAVIVALLVASFVVLLVLQRVVFRDRLPRLESASEEALTFVVPSEAAAKAFEAWLAARPRSVAPVATAAAAAPKDPATFVCPSCGTSNRVRPGALAACVKCGERAD